MGASARLLTKRRNVFALMVVAVVAAAAALVQFVPIALVAKWRAESLTERADERLAAGDAVKAKSLLREALHLEASNRTARGKLADTDLRLARYFRMSEGFFLGLQSDYELMERKRQLGDKLKSIKPRAA